jgi:hypothetical protein
MTPEHRISATRKDVPANVADEVAHRSAMAPLSLLDDGAACVEPYRLLYASGSTWRPVHVEIPSYGDRRCTGGPHALDPVRDDTEHLSR